jgi:hypothetical protein
MEDVEILDSYQKEGFKITPIPNPPSSYVRLVHGNNTSLYVDVSKNYMIKNPNYFERPTTPAEKEWIQNIMRPYANA